MNTKIIIIISISVLLIGGFFFFRDTQKDITNHPNSRSKIVMFGDSLIAGNGSTEGNSLPEQLGYLLGAPIENLGVPGNTSSDGVARLKEIPDDAKLVVVNLGGNDVLKRVPEETTLQNIEIIIREIQKTGAMAMIVSVRNGIFGGTFDKEYQEIAKRNKAIFMPNILDGLFGDSEYMADGIHPNDKGYRIIAEKIRDIVGPYL